MQISAQFLPAIGYFIIAVAGQIVGATLLPRTNGFLDLKWTLIAVASLILSFWTIAMLIQRGFALSIVAPLIAGLVPLGIGMVAMFLQGEPASATRVVLLILACVTITIAGLLP